MISFGNFGTGKILYSSLKVHCKSPHSWPSSCGKKQFLHSRLRRSWRNCFSPRLLTHSWGGFAMYLSWFIENFKFLYSWLFHSYRKFSVPKLPNDKGCCKKNYTNTYVFIDFLKNSFTFSIYLAKCWLCKLSNEVSYVSVGHLSPDIHQF